MCLPCRPNHPTFTHWLHILHPIFSDSTLLVLHLNTPRSFGYPIHLCLPWSLDLPLPISLLSVPLASPIFHVTTPKGTFQGELLAFTYGLPRDPSSCPSRFGRLCSCNPPFYDAFSILLSTRLFFFHSNRVRCHRSSTTP